MDNIKRKKLAEESKPLSEMLEEIDVESADRMSLRNDLTKLKRVAIELAKACVAIESSRKNKINPTSVRRIARIALLSAKDIIGGK